MLAPQGYEARRRLVQFVQGLDGQGVDGQGLDGQGLDEPGVDGQGLAGQGLDGQGLDGQGLNRPGPGSDEGPDVGYTRGKQSETPESPAHLELFTTEVTDTRLAPYQPPRLLTAVAGACGEGSGAARALGGVPIAPAIPPHLLRHLAGRGLHSSTLQLNISDLCVTGDAVRGCLGLFRGW